MSTSPGLDDRSLSQRAVTGSLWMGGVLFTAQVLRLATDLLLVRLLAPADFGLVALMGAMITMMDAFTQGGVDVSVTRSQRGDDEEFLSTAWTLQIGRSLLLWVVMLVASPPIASLYSEPRLLQLLPVMSFSIVLQGVTSTSLLYLGRHVSLRVPMLLFLGRQVIAVAVALAIAFVHQSVWALIIGNLAGVTFSAAASHFAVPGLRVRLRWDRASGKELIHFGKWIFAGNMVSSIGSRLDQVALGLLAPMATLGVYDIAAKYPFLVRRAGAIFARRLLLPILSRHHEREPDRFRDRVREVRGIFSLLGMAPILALFLFAPLYFDALFPGKYSSAGWTCQLLCITIWVTHVKFSAERVLLAIGDSKSTAAGNLWSLVGSVVGLSGGFAIAGMTGFLIGLALGPLLGHLWVQSRLARHGFPGLGQDLRYTGFLCGLALLGRAPSRLASIAGFEAEPAVSLLSGAFVMIGFLAVAYPRIRPLLSTGMAVTADPTEEPIRVSPAHE